MKSRLVVFGLSVALVGLATGCSSEPDEAAKVGPLVVAVPVGDVAYPAAEVPGELTLNGDCVALDGLPVLWPEGTTWSEEDQTVLLPDGAEVAVGQRIQGGGGVVPITVATNYGGDEVQEAIDTCAERAGVTNMALLASASVE